MRMQQVVFIIAIEASGVLLCLLGILFLLYGIRVERRTSRYLLGIYTALGIEEAANIALLLLLGGVGPVSYYGVRISAFLAYFSPFLLSFCIVWYVLHRVDPDWKQRRLRTLTVVLCAAGPLLLFLSQFTHTVYYIDRRNLVHRGPWFPAAPLLDAAVLLFTAVILRKNWRLLNRGQRTSFPLYVFFPLCGLAFNVTQIRLNVCPLTHIAAGLVLFVSILSDQFERFAAREKEAADLRIAATLSQLQPHFIYNSLNSIRYLCQIKPAAAVEAIDEFSGFLRGSIDVLENPNCVPVEDELNTVRHYLWMERLRFGDKLRVQTDIRDREYFLPAFTIQVLVENAVRHGVQQLVEGPGTVTLRLYPEGRAHVIEVLDDGVGFDPAALTHTGARGIGLRNTRRRLEKLCGGSLELYSAPGSGTAARVVIPFRASA